MSHDKQVITSMSIVTGILAFTAIVFYLVASSVTDDMKESDGSVARMEEKVAKNIMPVGQVHVGEVPVEAVPAAAETVAAGPRSGQDVYNASCLACHSTGVAGAPKVGDKAAWSGRAANGLDSLVANATNGINAMPPMGTCGACSADELKAAVEFMLEKTGL